ncbi:MAG TPA: hypothetical protein VFQ36_10740 [Ktedonobacteraceae bacterium]|nr:hypothetical protein [Ktedonobacteraceae bacterium]
MKTSATLWFWVGCIAIILLAALPSSITGLVRFFIIVAVLTCICQWYRNTRKLKNSLTQEQKKSRAAGQYINALRGKD